MSTSIPLRFALAAGLAAVLGCGSSASTSTTVTAPASSRCEATVSGPSSAFGPAGGTGTLGIAVARECSWRATSPVNWITFTSSAEGQGDGTVTFRVAENHEPVNRQVAVAVAERQVALAQQGAPCRYSISPPSSPIGGTGGEGTIEIDTHPACEWTVQAAQPWATVSPASGRGPAAVRVSVPANTGAARTLELVVAGERVTLTQGAFTAPPAPAPTPTPTPAPPAPTPPPAPPPPPAPAPAPPPTPPPSPTPPPAPVPTPPGPTPVRAIELEGDIKKLAGSCSQWTFELEGRTVYTTSATEYQRGPCTRMSNNMEIELKGYLMSDGRVRADTIRYDKDDDDDDEHHGGGDE